LSKAEPFKQWLVLVGYESVQEIENPELPQEQMKELYARKGYRNQPRNSKKHSKPRLFADWQTHIHHFCIGVLIFRLFSFVNYGWSLSNLVAMFRWNVFAYKDIWAWLDNPFESPPPDDDNLQPRLPSFGFGQQVFR